MTITAPVFGNKDRSSCYVRYLFQHQQLDETYEGLVRFGTPIAAANTNLRAATAVLANTRQNFAVPYVLDTPFGRTVNVNASAAGVVTVYGRDYLNQQITSVVTHAGAGTIATTKCFKYIDAVICTTAISVGLGSGPALGLPFVLSAALQEFLAGAATTLGTPTAADLTSPATGATGDPRGRYVPNSALNGTNVVEVKVRFRNDTPDGLYGVPQV